jgi:hypothetical protein
LHGSKFDVLTGVKANDEAAPEMTKLADPVEHHEFLIGA